METDLQAVLITAASLALMHTLFGPDHYLPFIMMATAGRWSRTKTMLVTLLCGVGHVLGSVVLGVVGIGLGKALHQMTDIESVRGDLAAWGLVAFGLAYGVWGLRRAIKNKPHTHWHAHADGGVHTHEHNHHGSHAHVHTQKAGSSITPWALFTIFVFGPCEVLIPLLMVPAVKSSFSGILTVATVFGVITIATMMAVVLVGTYGISFLPLGKLERYTHALAGAAICLCGLAIQFLGL